MSVNFLRHQFPALCLRCRAASSAASKPPEELWVTGIKLVKSRQQALEVEFNTGERFAYPAEYLRVESPAAGNQDVRDAQGRLKVVHGRRHVGIMGIEPIGSYAVRLAFDDMHSSGIYTWQHLHDLGTQKLGRMRRYIATLRDRGLSRDPSRRTSAAKAKPPSAHSELQTGGSSSGSSGG